MTIPVTQGKTVTYWADIAMINIVQMAAQCKYLSKLLRAGHITKSLTLSSHLYIALKGPCSVVGRSGTVCIYQRITLCARNRDLAYCRLSEERGTVRKNFSVTLHRTIILPVVLYGCETWQLTLREEHRLRLFENRVLSRIFRPKREDLTGDWRKLHNEEHNDLYSSPNIVRVIKQKE